MDNYEKLMKKCISLAKKGSGKTSPNPMVGCVVLDKNGNIISTGYHHKYGENHAERDALLKLKNGEEKGGTLVVNLEPCSHFGKTPPCADLIIERKLKKVIIGCRDNNPKVNGCGIQRLKSAGIEVINGVLEQDCKELNEIFFTNIEEKRPFVALKTATTIDGKIAASNGESKWITSEKSRIYARKLRQQYDAILTSSSTVLADNPKMLHKRKIILDRNLCTDFNSEIYKNGEIYLVTEKGNMKPDNIPNNVLLLECSTTDNGFDIKELTDLLYKNGIHSIFVESGGKLCGSFIKSRLVDKIYQFVAPKILNDNNGKSCFDGDSISSISDCKHFRLKNIKTIDNDIFITWTKLF